MWCSTWTTADVEEFILLQGREEAKARALRRPASTWTSTAPTPTPPVPERNNSVGLTDEFLRAYVADAEWA